MADISKLNISGTTYSVKDSTARSVFTGATASANGTAGQVPAPTSAQRNNFLKGDGTWGAMSVSNGLTIVADSTTAVYNGSAAVNLSITYDSTNTKLVVSLT
jgi:hypothetical protein